jgi:hypothetical protein
LPSQARARCASFSTKNTEQDGTHGPARWNGLCTTSAIPRLPSTAAGLPTSAE